MESQVQDMLLLMLVSGIFAVLGVGVLLLGVYRQTQSNDKETGDSSMRSGLSGLARRPISQIAFGGLLFVAALVFFLIGFALILNRPFDWQRVRLPAGFSLEFPGKPSVGRSGTPATPIRSWKVDLQAGRLAFYYTTHHARRDMGPDEVLTIFTDAFEKEMAKKGARVLSIEKTRVLNVPARHLKLRQDGVALELVAFILGGNLHRLVVAGPVRAEDRDRFFGSIKILSAQEEPRIKGSQSKAVERAERARVWLKRLGYRADWTIEGLREVDRFLDGQSTFSGQPRPGGFLAKDTDRKLADLGFYVGECLRRSHGGIWVFHGSGDSDDPSGVTLSIGKGKCWPLQKVRKRLRNGAEDGVYFYARALGEAMAGTREETDEGSKAERSGKEPNSGAAPKSAD